MFRSGKSLCVGCFVNITIMISFQWLNDGVMATLTGETVTDTPVCRLYRSCLLCTNMMLCCTMLTLVLYIVLLHLVK